VKKTLIIFALALTAVAGLAQDKKAAPAPAAKPAAPATAKPAGDDPVVITANGMNVTRSEFEGAIKTLPAEYQQFAMGPGKKQFAEDYLKMKLLAAEGMKQGLDKAPNVTRQIALMKDNLVATETVHKIEGNINIGDDDVKKYYDEHKNEYEEVRARHILIAPKGSPAAQHGEGKKELTDDEAKAKAEDLRKKLVAGANFEDLAKTESDDTGSGSRGGDLGAFAHGQMVPEFEKAAFDAKVGEVTPVVKTQFGYHIIKVESHAFTPIEQVKPAIEKQLRQKKLQDAIESLKNNANAKFDDAYFAPPPPPAAPAAAAPASPEKKH